MRHRHLLTTVAVLLAGLGFAPLAQAQTASSFTIRCSFVRTQQIDPMTQPGVEPSAHRHNIFAATNVHKWSTGQQLQTDGLGGHTSCNNSLDSASYMWPEALRDGVSLNPTFSRAYYTRVLNLKTYAGDPIDTVVKPYVGMNLLGGNKNATAPQPQSVMKWQCTNLNYGGGVRDYPPDCTNPLANGLAAHITFPSCWSGLFRPPGVQVDDVLPVVINNNVKKCPAGHDIQITQVRLGFFYSGPQVRDCRIAGTGACSNYTLATNPTNPISINQGHANFMQGWADDNPLDPVNGFGLNSLTARCNNPGTPQGCGDMGTVPPGDAF